MKNLILIAIIVALTVIALLSFQTCHSKSKEVKNTDQLILHKDDSVQHYKDLFGSEHGMRLQAEGKLEDLKAIYAHDIDSVAKRNNIKSNQIQSINEVGTKTTGSFVPTVDTINNNGSPEIQFHYSDKFIQEHGTIGSNSVVDYMIEDSITITSYWKRHWLLGRKAIYVNAYSLNPKVHITGVTGIKVSEKEPGRFGIGPFVGIGYVDKWRPVFGIALNYSLIRL